MLAAKGFSTNTFRPARSAAMDHSACAEGGRAMYTGSSEPSSTNAA
ncbi:hypothetical protein NLX83_20315 [Allokutzneria sp. A3M-2-11 16]|nr:hypothetical protein [Allokutzneria sp. A3M-2-11 16]MCP3801609.1 hypothetical protein [Allokutzneria sp. A3M-2-11 16]